MKILKLVTGLAFMLTLSIAGCKPKDKDLQASVEEKLKQNAETAAASVSVNDGVANLSGEVNTEAAKSSAAEMASSVKGVKSVLNNITVAMAAQASPTASTPPVIANDDALNSGVQDAVKDVKGVTASVADGVVTLTGQASKKDLRMMMMSINSLKPKKIENKLTIK